MGKVYSLLIISSELRHDQPGKYSDSVARSLEDIHAEYFSYV